MRLSGWAGPGVELEADGATVVVDPLDDAAAVFAPLGDASAGTPAAARRRAALRRGASPASSRTCTATTPTPRALSRGARPGAPVLEPPAGGGGASRTSRSPRPSTSCGAPGSSGAGSTPWETATAGPFTLTALPAVDGVGDPQVAWLVEADGVRVLHLGDTMFHGYWWRMALRHGPFDVVLVPVNGAVVGFPHRTPASPLPVALDPEQAAVAGRAARRAARDPDPRRGLRDRRRLRAGRRRGAALRRGGGRARGPGADPGARGDDRAERRPRERGLAGGRGPPVDLEAGLRAGFDRKLTG